MAQSTLMDSLMKVASESSSAQERVHALRKLAYKYVGSKPELAMDYARRGIILSRAVGFRRGEGLCLKVSGDALESIGNYPKALEYYLAALKIQEELGADADVAIVETCLGVIYSDQEDFAPALEYSAKARSIIERLPDQADLDVVLLNMGYYYYRLSHYDSALSLEQKAYDQARRVNRKEVFPYILNNLGLIQDAIGNKAVARGYFAQGLQDAVLTHDDIIAADISLSVAKQFTNEGGNHDSIIAYAKQSLSAATAASYAKGRMEAGLLLAKAYDTTKPLLAYAYYKEAQALKDDIYSAEKVKLIANMNFNERLRQQELSEARAARQEARRKNLQLAGVSICIPLVFLLLLLLTRVKVDFRLIDFLTIVSVLLLFEFVNLLIHDRVSNLVHHNPLMLLLLGMLLATTFAPLHHHFSKWLHDRLLHIHGTGHHDSPTKTPARKNRQS